MDGFLGNLLQVSLPDEPQAKAVGSFWHRAHLAKILFASVGGQAASAVLKGGARDDLVLFLASMKIPEVRLGYGLSEQLIDLFLAAATRRASELDPMQSTLSAYAMAGAKAASYWEKMGWSLVQESPIGSLMNRQLMAGRSVGGPTVGSMYQVLSPNLVYAFEPLAAHWRNTAGSSEKPVSEVARTRPRVGGWDAAVQGMSITQAALGEAVRRAQRQVGSSFWEWSYKTGRVYPGVDYREGDEPWYGFMAFYDWTQLNNIDLNRLIDDEGEPLPDRIKMLPLGSNARFVEWMTQWLNRRQGFVARHSAQLSDDPYTDDGRPTRRHLGLIMWAASPDPDRLKSAVRTNPE